MPAAICCTLSHSTPLQCQLQSAAHLHLPLLCSASCNRLHTFTSHSSASCNRLHTFTSHSSASCNRLHTFTSHSSASCNRLHTFTSHSSAVQLQSAAHLHIPLLCQLQSAAHLHIPLLCNLLHTFTSHSFASCNRLHTFISHSFASCNRLHTFTFHSSASCSGSPIPTHSALWWWCRDSCPWMSVDILGTNCAQCLSMVQCCFTSTETIRLVRMGSWGAQDGHLNLHTAPELCSISVTSHINALSPPPPHTHTHTLPGAPPSASATTHPYLLCSLDNRLPHPCLLHLKHSPLHTHNMCTHTCTHCSTVGCGHPLPPIICALLLARYIPCPTTTTTTTHPSFSALLPAIHAHPSSHPTTGPSIFCAVSSHVHPPHPTVIHPPRTLPLHCWEPCSDVHVCTPFPPAHPHPFSLLSLLPAMTT